MRPHLDYRDVLCDQMFNNYFNERLESIQYKVVVAITGVIRGSSIEKNLSKIRLWIPTATAVVQDTLSLFQGNKKPVPQEPLSINTKEKLMWQDIKTVFVFLMLNITMTNLKILYSLQL